jgi:hypothetical protein
MTDVKRMHKPNGKQGLAVTLSNNLYERNVIAWLGKLEHTLIHYTNGARAPDYAHSIVQDDKLT